MAEDPPPLNTMLVARYALLVALCQLIPIPVLDSVVDSALRRRLCRVLLTEAGVEASRKEVRMLGDGSAGGCLGMLWSLVSWPFRRLLRYVLWVLLVKAMIDTFSDVVARAILVDQALRTGRLPGDAVAVRAAMQRALKRTDIRPLERGVGLVFQASRGELRRLWRQARGRVRTEARREREQVEASEVDEAPLSAGLEPLSQALARALWVPEVHEQLRALFDEEAEGLPTGAVQAVPPEAVGPGGSEEDEPGEDVGNPPDEAGDTEPPVEGGRPGPAT
jgi:hypothetical protein